ncbi:MAG: helix-turn-helix domain-containing protein [Bacilli bacterium]|jgi:lambda repressor-like predicted transcriptional regulator
MNPNEIKSELIKLGISQKEIARRCGVATSTVNQVLSGIRVSAKIRTEIASAIGKPANEIWPDDVTQANKLACN